MLIVVSIRYPFGEWEKHWSRLRARMMNPEVRTDLLEKDVSLNLILCNCLKIPTCDKELLEILLMSYIKIMEKGPLIGTI